MPGPGTGKSFVHFRVDQPAGAAQWLPAESVGLDDDNVNPNSNGLFVGAQMYLFDERASRLVRARSNRSGDVLLASASRTVTTNSTTQTNRNWKGLHCVIDVTVHGGGLGIVPRIQGNAPNVSGGTFYDILVGTTIAATGVIVIKVYPGIGALAGGAANDLLPYNWRFQMTALDATAHTYVVEAELEI